MTKRTKIKAPIIIKDHCTIGPATPKIMVMTLIL